MLFNLRLANPIVLILLFLFFLQELQAQTRKPLQRRKEQPPVAQYIALSGGINTINGLRWEIQLRDKNSQPSRSTVSFLGGLSLRYPEYEIINWTDSTIRTEHQWTQGIGITAFLNHYRNSDLSGLYWSAGVGGHVFFRNHQQYKIFSTLFQAGYIKPVSGRFHLDIHLGAGVMGTIFKNSTAAEVNGFFLQAGVSARYQMR